MYSVKCLFTDSEIDMTWVSFVGLTQKDQLKMLELGYCPGLDYQYQDEYSIASQIN